MWCSKRTRSERVGVEEDRQAWLACWSIRELTDANEHYIWYKPRRQTAWIGFWGLEATKEPNRGKCFWMDFPKELFC